MRTIRAIFCLYVVVWFNFVVPGHTRGIVALPSPCDSVDKTASCCAADRAVPGKASEPTPLQKKNCAICYVAATYMAAAWFTIDLCPSGNVISVHRDAAAAVPSIEFPLTHYATGPPAIA